MTLVDVLDTVVKIGLGALISGASAYWLTKAKATSDLRAERLRRHHTLLEQCAEQIESFSHVLFRYWALIAEHVRNKAAGSELLPHRREELEKTKGELFNAFSSLTSAEAKLLLLGHKNVQEQLRVFGELAKAVRQKAWDGNDKLTSTQMDEYRRDLLSERAKLFELLSEGYRRET